MEYIRTTPEQSVILKKLGYDVPDTHFWHEHLTQGWIAEQFEDIIDYNNGYSWHYTRPKLTDAATWLRTVHGWHVSVISTNKNKFWLFIVTDCEGFEYHYGKADDENTFSTHDLALSAGIDFILTKLNENDHHHPTN
jgi:hypothetical protein